MDFDGELREERKDANWSKFQSLVRHLPKHLMSMADLTILIDFGGKAQGERKKTNWSKLNLFICRRFDQNLKMLLLLSQSQAWMIFRSLVRQLPKHFMSMADLTILRSLCKSEQHAST